MVKFGTGGWRAIIGDDFIKENILEITKALCCLNIRAGNKPIIVGYDNRFLSEEAADWICDYFSEHGIDTYSYNSSVPTPLVMWHTKKYEFDYGIMVTASHNPYNYNGIKVFVKGGLDAPRELTDEIEDIIVTNECRSYAAGKVGQKYLMPDYASDYIEDLETFIDFDAIAKAKPRIYFNNMNGSAGRLFESILDDLDCEYRDYGIEADPYFYSSDTNTPEPNEKNIFNFINWEYIIDKYSIDEKPAFSLIFDGDGDRLMVLDEDKHVVNMNMLLCIYYWYLHEYRNQRGPVIKNCVTTLTLNKIAEYYREHVIEVPVGFKWITEAMTRYDGLIGGESSGGFTYNNHVYGKDSIMASLMLLEAVAVTGKSVKELVNIINEQFGSTVEISEKIPLSEVHVDFNNITISPDEAYKDPMDGVKFTYSFGWGSIRKSGTEPVLRVMVEADTQEHAEYILNSLKNQL